MIKKSRAFFSFFSRTPIFGRLCTITRSVSTLKSQRIFTCVFHHWMFSSVMLVPPASTLYPIFVTHAPVHHVSYSIVPALAQRLCALAALIEHVFHWAPIPLFPCTCSTGAILVAFEFLPSRHSSLWSDRASASLFTSSLPSLQSHANLLGPLAFSVWDTGCVVSFAATCAVIPSSSPASLSQMSHHPIGR